MLVRTQLMLDKETKRKLEILSRAEGRSMSDVVREALEKDLKRRKRAQNPVLFLENLAKWAEKGTRGPGDSEYDKYAYDL